jgi:hypothetical protein
MVAANNEMPAPFHLLAGASVIGNMIGLGAWCTLAKGVRVYPNLNTLLLSPAGKCRRGEGTKITMAIAKRAGVNVFAGKTTPEGLVDDLIEDGDLILYVEELSMLLTKQEFQIPMISVLTKLLLHGEGEAGVRTRAMGARRMLPYVNLTAVFTSAPDWFVHTIPEAAYGGGMMSRFLVCCLSDREIYHIDIQADDATSDEVLDNLAGELKQVGRVLKGHVRGTNSAQRWIEEWYMENERAVVSDERFLPHRNRKPASLLRVAMILCAAAGTATLGKEKLEEALAILDWIEPTLLELFGTTDAMIGSMNKGEKRILGCLGGNRGGALLHSQLSRACASYFKGGTREMKWCLEGLIEKGRVVPLYKGEHVKKWPPRAWQITTPEEIQEEETGVQETKGNGDSSRVAG